MKFLVFDMDGVLVDTSGCHSRAYHELWERCGIKGPGYDMIAGRATREVVEQFTRELVPAVETIAEWVTFKQQRAREYLRVEPVVYDDVLPMCEAIRRAGIGMGVATGASRETADLLLDRAGVARLVRFVLTAEDVSRSKPDPEVYRMAVELSGVPGGEAVIVEDSASGLAAAAAARTPVACVRSGLQVSSPYFLGSFSGLVDLAKAIGVEVA